MVYRDSLYRLNGTIELDDALVGGRHKGKRAQVAHSDALPALNIID